MSDPHDPLAWVEKAEEDYALASSALRKKKPGIYSACFHTQQCEEARDALETAKTVRKFARQFLNVK